MGIEPTAPAWEAGVLPLYDARISRSLSNFVAELKQKFASSAVMMFVCTKNIQARIWLRDRHSITLSKSNR